MSVARPRRTEAPEVRRRQILDAATRRFRDHGLHATKMADVAVEAGVSIGMIYQYFPSREALIEGMVLDAAERQVAGIAAIFSDASSLRAAVGEALEAFNATMVLQHEQTTLMLEIAGEAARNKALRPILQDMEARVRPALRKEVARLKPAEWSFEELEARFDLFFGTLSSAALRYSAEARAPTPELRRLMEEAADWLFAPPASGG